MDYYDLSKYTYLGSSSSFIWKTHFTISGFCSGGYFYPLSRSCLDGPSPPGLLGQYRLHDWELWNENYLLYTRLQEMNYKECGRRALIWTGFFIVGLVLGFIISHI